MEYTHAVQARSPNHFFRVNVPAIPKKRKKEDKKEKNKNKNIKRQKNIQNATKTQKNA